MPETLFWMLPLKSEQDDDFDEHPAVPKPVRARDRATAATPV
jgi:hypothetical protein